MARAAAGRLCAGPPCHATMTARPAATTRRAAASVVERPRSASASALITIRRASEFVSSRRRPSASGWPTAPAKRERDGRCASGRVAGSATAGTGTAAHGAGGGAGTEATARWASARRPRQGPSSTVRLSTLISLPRSELARRLSSAASLRDGVLHAPRPHTCPQRCIRVRHAACMCCRLKDRSGRIHGVKAASALSAQTRCRGARGFDVCRRALLLIRAAYGRQGYCAAAPFSARRVRVGYRPSWVFNKTSTKTQGQCGLERD